MFGRVFWIAEDTIINKQPGLRIFSNNRVLIVWEKIRKQADNGGKRFFEM